VRKTIRHARFSPSPLGNFFDSERAMRVWRNW
jgi:hypothetical protein